MEIPNQVRNDIKCKLLFYENQFKNIEKKIARRRRTVFKNALLCCRASGNVYNYKAQQRVAGKPAILKTVIRLEAIF